MAGDDKTKEQLDAEWWDAWWAEDFSWDGLARKPWSGWFVQADGSVRGKEGEIWPILPQLAGGGAEDRRSETVGANIAPVAAPSVSPAGAGDPPPPLRGGGQPATLQDYWRRDPATGAVRTDEDLLASGELVRDPQGKLWHIVHMPVEWRIPPGVVLPRAAGEVAAQPPEGAATSAGDFAPSVSPAGAGDPPPPLRGGGQGGRPLETWKSALYHPDWERIAAIVSARIGAGAETKVDWQGDAGGPDGRAQLSGAVLKTLSKHPQGIASPIHIAAIHSIFLVEVVCSNSAFGPVAWFTSARFAGDAVFTSASFAAFARFSSARFAGDAVFNRVSFAGNAWFYGARFAGLAGFNRASFAGLAGFNRASFAGTASFNSASFAWGAQFANASFAGNTGFESASFAGGAGFTSASFAGDARFDNASFAWDARFRHTAFCGRLSLDTAWFGGQAVFTGDGALMQAPAIQQTIRPKQRATPGAGDAGAPTFEMETPAAILPIARRSFPVISAAGAVFAGDAEFSNRDILAPSSFAGAQFFGRAAFHESDIHQGTSFFGARFEPALSRDPVETEKLPEIPPETARRMWQADCATREARGEALLSQDDWRKAFDTQRRKRAAEARDEALKSAHEKALSADPKRVPAVVAHWAEGPHTLRDEHFAELESCFRTLKLAMEENRSRLEENKFFRLELRARRKRPALRRPLWGRSDGPRAPWMEPAVYWAKPAKPAPPKTEDAASAPTDAGPAGASRAGDDRISAIEKLFSYLYDLFSGYGSSLLRPLMWLGGLWLVFGIAYYAMAGLGDRTAPHWRNAEVAAQTPDAGIPYACAYYLQVGNEAKAKQWCSGAAAAAPVESPLRVERPDWQAAAVLAGERTLIPIVQSDNNAHDWWRAATREHPLVPFLVGFLHRLMAAVLIFLLALALRRRFQIN